MRADCRLGGPFKWQRGSQGHPTRFRFQAGILDLSRRLSLPKPRPRVWVTLALGGQPAQGCDTGPSSVAGHDMSRGPLSNLGRRGRRVPMSTTLRPGHHAPHGFLAAAQFRSSSRPTRSTTERLSNIGTKNVCFAATGIGLDAKSASAECWGQLE
jgi:hypothetical protein